MTAVVIYTLEGLVAETIPDALPDEIEWMDVEARIDSWLRTAREIRNLPEVRR